MTNSSGIEGVAEVRPVADEKPSLELFPAFIEAYEFFRERDGELGRDFEDCFRSGREIRLRGPATESVAETVAPATVPGFKPDMIKVSVEDDDVLIFQPNDWDSNTAPE